MLGLIDGLILELQDLKERHKLSPKLYNSHKVNNLLQKLYSWRSACQKCEKCNTEGCTCFSKLEGALIDIVEELERDLPCCNKAS